MNVKKLAKKILCPFQCLRLGIKHRKGFLYIGFHCKLVRAANIYFGENVSIMPDNMVVCLNDKAKVVFGDGAEIGMYSRIDCQNYVEIGENVLTGPHIFIADYNHEYRNPDKPIKCQGNMISSTPEFSGGGVRIGADTWLGTNVVISGSVTIGKHCVIGANSVVTHDIPDYSVAVGSPCRVIKKYDFESKTWKKV
jgi:galactoside O-acetyltransferase